MVSARQSQVGFKKITDSFLVIGRKLAMEEILMKPKLRLTIIFQRRLRHQRDGRSHGESPDTNLSNSLHFEKINRRLKIPGFVGSNSRIAAPACAEITEIK